MRYACVNCLEPVGNKGVLCDQCRELVSAGWYQTACWVNGEGAGWPDEAYIEALRERRSKSFLRARRMAAHGR
jgi:hypothetical protein